MSRGTADAPGRIPWWSVERIDPQDVGRELGLVGGNASWALFGLYAGVTVTLATLFGQPVTSQPSGLAVIVGLLVAAFLLVSPSRTPLPLGRTVIVIAIVLGAVATVTWQQPFHDHYPGPAGWELGCSNLLLFGLALRARVLAAWVGEAAFLSVVGLWSILETGSPLYGFGFTYGQPISLAAGTVFAIALHRAVRRIADFRAAERERAGLQASDSAVAGARDAELLLVRELAEPILDEIAEGQNPSRDEVRTLEAALRDVLRGRSLAVEPLVSALRVSRQRGVDVVLLDDLGDIILPAGQLQSAAEWSARRVEEMDSRVITIRLVGRAGGAVVTVADERGRRQEWELGGGQSSTSPSNGSARQQESAVD